MPLTLGRYDSPIGPLAIATDDDILLAIDFNGDVKALAHRLSLPDTAAGAFPDAARPLKSTHPPDGRHRHSDARRR